jgi:hypothetical protein
MLRLGSCPFAKEEAPGKVTGASPLGPSLSGSEKLDGRTGPICKG